MLAIGVIDPEGSQQRWMQLWQQGQQARSGHDLRSDTSTGGPAPSIAGPAVTDRWRATTDGMAAAAVSQLGMHRMDHPGYSARETAARTATTPSTATPAVRIGIALPCDELPADLPSTSQLRASFLRFLEQSAVAGLVDSLTSVSSPVSWRTGESNGRVSLGAVLTRSDHDDTPPIAWARLMMHGSDASGARHDHRRACFILYVEPRTPDGAIAPPVSFSSWPGRFTDVLQVPETLARFLTDDLGLATHDDPDTCAAIWLTAPTALVDIEDATRLPGTTPAPTFTGYVIADPAGDRAATAARQLVRHLADYTLYLDGYEHLLPTGAVDPSRPSAQPLAPIVADAVEQRAGAQRHEESLHLRAELDEALGVLNTIRWSLGEPSGDLVGRAVTLLHDRVGTMTPEELGFTLLRCERITISTNAERKVWFEDLITRVTQERDAIRDRPSP